MIKKATLAMALALSLGPTLVSAACGHDYQQQAMSCAEGMVFDKETNTCITTTG